VNRKVYEAMLGKLQIALCRLQYWVVQAGLRMVVVFEWRGATGSGGMIGSITERVHPRVFRLSAFPALLDRERTQIYSGRPISACGSAMSLI
jgi:polyphosphate kinase 2 (PPK2 family)